MWERRFILFLSLIKPTIPKKVFWHLWVRLGLIIIIVHVQYLLWRENSRSNQVATIEKTVRETFFWNFLKIHFFFHYNISRNSRNSTNSVYMKC